MALKVVGSPDGLPDYPIATGERLESHFFIPWHFNRWLNSDFRMKATPEVRGYAFDLFCLAQNQSPVGTLPNDDLILARLAMVSLETWQELCARDVGPMYGWRLCKCGDETRWMHTVVLEMAEGSLIKKKEVVDGRAADRDRKRLKLLVTQMEGAGVHSHMSQNAVIVERLDAFLLEHLEGNRTATKICEALDAMETIRAVQDAQTGRSSQKPLI